MAKKSQIFHIFNMDFQGLYMAQHFAFPPIRWLSKCCSTRVITVVWAEHKRPESSRNTAVNELPSMIWKFSANKYSNMCIMCIIMNTNPSPRHLTLVLLEAYGFLAKLLQVSRTGANQILITNMDTVIWAFYASFKYLELNWFQPKLKSEQKSLK